MPHPITSALISWYAAKARNLPWRASKNPYFIWLSEVILQQTRVDQGLKYYHHFTENYPTVLHLAQASEDQVLRSWQGLGYYSRARNLHAAAQQIASSHQGQFPSSYDEIRKLKGVGDYTAAAVASIAFSLPYPAVDGNVNRVISRLFCVEQDPLSTQGKARIKALSAELLSVEKPGTYNQAMMELGATVCKPRNPDCLNCPLNAYCEAYRTGKTADFPLKKTKTKEQSLYMLYVIPEDAEGNTWLRRRSEKGIWQGLYEFPLISLAGPVNLENQEIEAAVHELFPQITPLHLRLSNEYLHLLTHRRLHIRFLRCKLNALPESPDYQAVELSHLSAFALPRAITRYLEEEPLT